MYLLGYEILLPGELLYSQVDCLLEVHDFFLKLVDFFVENLDSFLVLFVLLKNPSKFLLLNDYLIENGVIVDKISALQFSISLQILVLFLGGLDARPQCIGLSVQLVEEVGL